MDQKRGCEEMFQNGRSYGSHQIAQDVAGNCKCGGELDAQLLLVTDGKQHRHGQYGQEQLVAYAAKPAGEGDSGVEQREAMDDH